jgi:hypothetical protein
LAQVRHRLNGPTWPGQSQSDVIATASLKARRSSAFHRVVFFSSSTVRAAGPASVKEGAARGAGKEVPAEGRPYSEGTDDLRIRRALPRAQRPEPQSAHGFLPVPVLSFFRERSPSLGGLSSQALAPGGGPWLCTALMASFPPGQHAGSPCRFGSIPSHLFALVGA